LRAISAVVAFCSSTAAAMTAEIVLISPMVSRFVWMAATTSLVDSSFVNEELYHGKMAAGGRIGRPMTAGVAALPASDQAAILAKVIAHDEFTEDNDPHCEHDFGVRSRRATHLLETHYYDQSLEYGSEDPADLAKTTRVLTIMPADEY
jgi:hypothetical protein